jgi:hypothetical protein
VHRNPACLLHLPTGLAVPRIEEFWKGVVRGVVKHLNFPSLVLGITSPGRTRSAGCGCSVSWMGFVHALCRPRYCVVPLSMTPGYYGDMMWLSDRLPTWGT